MDTSPAEWSTKVVSHGFTLVELLIGLALAGVVSTAIYQVLVTAQRTHFRQAQLLELRDNLHTAAALLPAELRELDATDPLGSDLVAISESTVTYKAMRNLYITCAEHSMSSRIHLDTGMIGLRAVDPERDSVLIFADGSVTTANDDRWVHRDVSAADRGNGCPGGAPSIDLTMTAGVSTADSVTQGSPVRSFEVVQVRSYRDGAGDVWLGQRSYHKLSDWSHTQPIAGPLVAGGLRFSYFDAAGTITSDPGQVVRIGLSVIARTARRVRTSSGAIRHVVDTVTTQVALRNNRR